MGITTFSITAAIPTYGRDAVLRETIQHLLGLDPPASEILVIDQTPMHDAATEGCLRAWDRGDRIRWIRVDKASITHAMNIALQKASCPIILFLDDDVIPSSDMLNAHMINYKDEKIWAVAGQVLQPGEESSSVAEEFQTLGLSAYLDFPFNSRQATFVENAMAGNLSLRRDKAIEIGGFDENFVGVAYRFETEFSRRLCKAGGKIRFEPGASIRHLRTASGGTRFYGNHLTSPSPMHGAGDYYFALRQGLGSESFIYMLKRPFREICTKFHLKHPWYVPVKLVSELLAIFLAFFLFIRGPRYVGVKNS